MSAPSIVAAAHELKAPLALIRQLALSLEMEGASLGDTMRLASRIVHSSERALRLTTDLTRASRLQGTLFEFGPINPVELCEDVASELEPLFKERGLLIQARRNRRNLLAIANRDLLRRIVANFSDNALHYADGGDGIELISSENHGAIRISVRDYGPAIPSQIWRELNQSLGKAAQVVGSRPASSGLGLYLAAQFAEHMNGQVGAIRHRDGATFFVELPASRQLSLL